MSTGTGRTDADPAGSGLEAALARLGERSEPTDFELRVLRHVGVPQSRYDAYALLDAPAGGLYVAHGPAGVTGAALGAEVADGRAFEELHRGRTGRAAIPAATPPPGVRGALRTGRAKQLRIDLSGLTPVERSVLTAVREIPRGQLRPVSWVAREAGLHDGEPVPEALARNPVHLLVPCHRVAHDAGPPCDAAYGPRVGEALRRDEGIEPEYLRDLLRGNTVFLGSDTTHIYCHPTCAHARRITPPHRVPFRTVGAARSAGYRPCKSCRPLAA
ncbi:MGMT family protein [Streptomyces sp. NPDC046215]|uniref:Cysteine methyltransferase n=1 Tax=Streptomyces stramineus TaxID=173861 RepID=A0ABN1A8S2_9ACTN